MATPRVCNFIVQAESEKQWSEGEKRDMDAEGRRFPSPILLMVLTDEP